MKSLTRKENLTLRLNNRSRLKTPNKKLTSRLRTFGSRKSLSLASSKLTNWIVWSGWLPCMKIKWTEFSLTTWASAKRCKRLLSSVTCGRVKTNATTLTSLSHLKARSQTGCSSFRDGLLTSKLLILIQNKSSVTISSRIKCRLENLTSVWPHTTHLTSVCPSYENISGTTPCLMRLTNSKTQSRSRCKTLEKFQPKGDCFSQAHPWWTIFQSCGHCSTFWCHNSLNHQKNLTSGSTLTQTLTRKTLKWAKVKRW